MPVVVATITPKPGKLEEARSLLTSVIPEVHEEPGCERYALHQGEGVLVMVEHWATAEALETHNHGPALAKLFTGLGELIDGADIKVLDAVPAGDPAKGTV